MDKDLIKKALGGNLIEELGLGILPEEQKVNLIAALTELIGVRFMARVSEKLDAADQDHFMKLAKGDAPEELFSWLGGKQVAVEEILLEEIARAKEEMRKRAAAIK